MPGPLTYTSIALMARDRVRQIRDTLTARNRISTNVNDIEKQIQYLATKCYGLMTADQPSFDPPLRLYGPPLTDQVSKFLLTGAVGPEIPSYAGMSADRTQTWLRNILHKGTPDENKEMVIASSANFILEFWTRVQPLLGTEFTDEKKRAQPTSNMRAYVLGHLCHIAADVITSPYIAELEWRLGTNDQGKLTRDQVIGAIEAKVATDLLGRKDGHARSSDWGDWWPKAGDLPDSFYKAYRQAIENTYGATRRTGFGEVEDDLKAHPPLTLDEGLIRDGYSTLRTYVQLGSAWDTLDWVLATFSFYIPVFLAMPFASLLPHGKDVFSSHKPAGFDQKAGIYEIAVFSYAITSLIPLLGVLILSFSYSNASGSVIFGWINAVLQVAAAIGFFATISGGPSTAKWVFFYVLPILLSIAQIVVTFIGGRDPRHVQLAFSAILHIGLSLLFLLFYYAVLHLAVEELNDPNGKKGFFVLGLFLWLVGLAGLCAFLSWILKKLMSSEPDESAIAFVTKNTHRIRLFDDTTLFTTAGGTSPTLADLYYPSGRRKLIKMWCSVAGATILPDHTDLVFTLGAKTVTIQAPTAPVSLKTFAAYLQDAVQDAGNNKVLTTKLVYPTDDDYDLPAGAVFSDAGDDKTTQADHDTAAKVAQPLGKDENSAFTLYHAPKIQQSIPYLTTGPAINDEDRTAQVNGTGAIAADAITGRTITVSGPNPTPFTKFFRAGDLLVATPNPIPRVIVSVDSDTQLTISSPFTPPIPIAPAAGVGFARGIQNRKVDFPSPAGLTVQMDAAAVHPNFNILLLSGAGQFGAFFMPGDIVRVTVGGKNEDRMVLRVIDDTHMRISQDIPTAGAPFAFVRVGEEPKYAWSFPANGDDTLQSADSVMNHAADLAALLCLGGTAHLLDDGDTKAAQVGTKFDLEKVYQVFRNWNLDRRRENEWRMLVLGGAVSEKRGDPTAKDTALPTVPSSSKVYVPAGEPTTVQVGWLPLLRSWLDMASRPATDTKATISFRAGNPTNLALSQAMAFLFEMRDPAS